jgi:HD domain/GAF domain
MPEAKVLPIDRREDGQGPGLPGAPRSVADLLSDLGPMQDATDLPDLFAGLAHAVRRAVDAEAALVSLYDAERDLVWDMGASVRPPATLNHVSEEYKLSEYPATRNVVSSGESLEVSVSDLGADPRELSFMREFGFERSLICRITHEGKPLGVVEAFRIHDRPFCREDAAQIDVLSAFASNAYSRIQLAAQLESHYTETMEALVSALEARDPYTQAHAGRIRDVAMGLAIALKLGPEERRAVKLGSILHDVGKIGVPDAILLKPGALTEGEWSIMRSHPAIGARMLQAIDFLRPALPIIRHHHERWDGRGYPDGLSGETIPIGARIVAVCDAYDAMTSDRPYRTELSVEAALKEIASCAGTQFDPDCAALLAEVVGIGEALEDRLVRYAS